MQRKKQQRCNEKHGHTNSILESKMAAEIYLEAALEIARDQLPEYWRIEIEIERDSLIIGLYDDDGVEVPQRAGPSGLADRILAALEIARRTDGNEH